MHFADRVRQSLAAALAASLAPLLSCALPAQAASPGPWDFALGAGSAFAYEYGGTPDDRLRQSFPAGNILSVSGARRLGPAVVLSASVERLYYARSIPIYCITLPCDPPVVDATCVPLSLGVRVYAAGVQNARVKPFVEAAPALVLAHWTQRNGTPPRRILDRLVPGYALALGMHVFLPRGLGAEAAFQYIRSASFGWLSTAAGTGVYQGLHEPTLVGRVTWAPRF